MPADIAAHGPGPQQTSGGVAFHSPTVRPSATRASVRAMIQETVRAHGLLDVIFNNAGVAQTKPFLDITEEDWRFVTDVNALGVLIGMQEAIRQMQVQARDGALVVIAPMEDTPAFEAGIMPHRALEVDLDLTDALLKKHMV